MHFQKLPPRHFSYRNFSNYRNANFINSLNEVLPEEENMESLSKDPNSLCEKVLNQHALYKKVYLRGNNKTFMNKECKKNVCLRSFSGPNFPAFGLNMEIYFVNLRIQSKCRKIRTRKTENTDSSHALKILSKV